MAGEGEVKGAAAALGRCLTWASTCSSAAGGLMIIGLMIAINTDVGGRYVFNHPIPGTAEVISASIVSIVFLQLPDCVRTGRMIRSGILIDRILTRRPRLGELFETVFSIIGLMMLCIMVRYLGAAFHKAWSAHNTIGVPGIFTAPIWPFYLLVLIGTMLAVLEYARAVLVHLNRFRAARR